jgi:hypothetical protein
MVCIQFKTHQACRAAQFLNVLIKTLEFLPHRFATDDQFGVRHVFEVWHGFRHEFHKG